MAEMNKRKMTTPAINTSDISSQSELKFARLIINVLYISTYTVQFPFVLYIHFVFGLNISILTFFSFLFYPKGLLIMSPFCLRFGTKFSFILFEMFFKVLIFYLFQSRFHFLLYLIVLSYLFFHIISALFFLRYYDCLCAGQASNCTAIYDKRNNLVHTVKEEGQAGTGQLSCRYYRCMKFVADPKLSCMRQPVRFCQDKEKMFSLRRVMNTASCWACVGLVSVNAIYFSFSAHDYEQTCQSNCVCINKPENTSLSHIMQSKVASTQTPFDQSALTILNVSIPGNWSAPDERVVVIGVAVGSLLFLIIVATLIVTCWTMWHEKRPAASTTPTTLEKDETPD